MKKENYKLKFVQNDEKIHLENQKYLEKFPQKEKMHIK